MLVAIINENKLKVPVYKKIVSPDKYLKHHYMPFKSDTANL